jgi:hypothetical protein
MTPSHCVVIFPAYFFKKYLQIVYMKAADAESYTRVGGIIGGGSREEIDALFAAMQDSKKGAENPPRNKIERCCTTTAGSLASSFRMASWATGSVPWIIGRSFRRSTIVFSLSPEPKPFPSMTVD